MLIGSGIGKERAFRYTFYHFSVDVGNTEKLDDVGNVTVLPRNVEGVALPGFRNFEGTFHHIYSPWFKGNATPIAILVLQI